MKRILCATVVLTLAGAASALQAQETRTRTESVTRSGDTKVKTETVIGPVKSYEEGKTIEIEGPGDKTYSFDLDENARVEGTIAVGQRAKVVYRTENGVRRVTVLSEASGEAVAAATGSKSHTESTTTMTSAEGKSKVKTEVVVGTVKEYEAGKKIVVTGPKKKNYSFDLDEGATLSGTVAVGDRVKVTYSRESGHKKVHVVAPYTGKA